MTCSPKNNPPKSKSEIIHFKTHDPAVSSLSIVHWTTRPLGNVESIAQNVTSFSSSSILCVFGVVVVHRIASIPMFVQHSTVLCICSYAAIVWITQRILTTTFCRAKKVEALAFTVHVLVLVPCFFFIETGVTKTSWTTGVTKKLRDASSGVTKVSWRQLRFWGAFP